MRIEDVVIVGEICPFQKASEDEVDTLESQLWIKFPTGYRDYVTRLGVGTLGGDFVRIYVPEEVQTKLVSWRQRIKKYWFWDESLDLLPKARALECVIIGDAGQCNELIFHPCRPDRFFVLPREKERAFQVCGDLLQAVDWMCGSGELCEPFPERDFVPFPARQFGPFDTRNERIGGLGWEAKDPEGESLDEIVELGSRWVERQNAREINSENLRAEAGENAKTELVFEAIVLTGYSVGYSVKYSITDEKSGEKLGVFNIGYSGDSSSYSYTPTTGTWQPGRLRTVGIGETLPFPKRKRSRLRTVGIGETLPFQKRKRESKITLVSAFSALRLKF